METELENLRREMLDDFAVMDSEMAELYRATACLCLRDCLSRANELGFDVRIRFSQGRREIELVKTDECDKLWKNHVESRIGRTDQNTLYDLQTPSASGTR